MTVEEFAEFLFDNFQPSSYEQVSAETGKVVREVNIDGVAIAGNAVTLNVEGEIFVIEVRKI